MKNGSSTTGPTLIEEQEGIAPGVEQDIRYCDLVAFHISKIAGAPRFEVMWPQERRDRAVTACAEFLERYGPLLRADAGVRSFDVGVLLKIPPLGRPATREDVAAARAIFALEGDVRTVNLPGFPQEARWLTLKDAPQDVRVGNGPPQIRYQDDGWVWQAEEVREGDRWVRYYGFVGRHTIGKAPASEVEFGPRYGWWTRLSGGLDARLEVVQPTADGRPPRAAGFEPGRPIALVLRLHNPAGIDRACPTEFLRPAPDGKPALRNGLVLKVARSKAAGSKFAGQQPGSQGSEPPTREPSNRLAGFEPAGASRVLAPAETFEALRVDLADWFDLPAPGVYSVSLTLAPEAGLGEGELSTYSFQVGGE